MQRTSLRTELRTSLAQALINTEVVGGVDTLTTSSAFAAELMGANEYGHVDGKHFS